jgi:hypothetical protein
MTTLDVLDKIGTRVMYPGSSLLGGGRELLPASLY